MILIEFEWVFFQFETVVKKVSILFKREKVEVYESILAHLSQNKSFPIPVICLSQSPLSDTDPRALVCKVCGDDFQFKLNTQDCIFTTTKFIIKSWMRKLIIHPSAATYCLYLFYVGAGPCDICPIPGSMSTEVVIVVVLFRKYVIEISWVHHPCNVEKSREYSHCTQLGHPNS